MFCTAEAPTSPGINERFSTPYHPWSTQSCTMSSHVSPEPHLRYTKPSSDLVSTPFMAECTTVPSKSPVSSRLLPSPMMSRGKSSSSREQKNGAISVSLSNSTNRLHVASMPKVLCSFRLYCEKSFMIFQPTFWFSFHQFHKLPLAVHFLECHFGLQAIRHSPYDKQFLL